MRGLRCLRPCSCGEIETLYGILDFYLPYIFEGGELNHYLTLYSVAVSFSDDSNEGFDGSAYTRWGYEYPDNVQVICEAGTGPATIAAWSGDRLLRREQWGLAALYDSCQSNPGLLEDHPLDQDPHGGGWSEDEGDWEVQTPSGRGLLVQTSTGDGRASVAYKCPDSEVTAVVLTTSDEVEVGILARGDGTLAGSIRLHFSKPGNTAELFIYGASMGTFSLPGGEDPHYVAMLIRCDEEDITASIRGYNSSGVALSAGANSGAADTDSSYNYLASDFRWGVYGNKDTDRDVIFETFLTSVFQVEALTRTRSTLYSISPTGADRINVTRELGKFLAPNVILPTTVNNFSLSSTSAFKFLEDDSSLTTVSVTATDASAGDGFSDRENGLTAGFWEPTAHCWDYGLGILRDGDDWVLYGGAVSFPSGTEWPVVAATDEIDRYTLAPFSRIRPTTTATVSYTALPDGTVSVVWQCLAHVTNGFQAFTRRVFNAGGPVVITDTPAGSPVVAPGAIACMFTDEFRIYSGGGIAYSDSHATRWDSASVVRANDNWFYVTNVDDWAGYITHEPSSVSTTPDKIDMLISHDGSLRIRACQYDEDNSEYDQTSFAVNINAITDNVKISNLNYSLPATIVYPDP